MNPADYFNDRATGKAPKDATAEQRQDRCPRCSSEDVRWRLQTGKWTLFSLQPGKLHQCKLNADAFGS